MDINQISIYLNSANTHALANFVSHILEREFVVDAIDANKIAVDLGRCTLNIISTQEVVEKYLPIDIKLDSREQFYQIEQKVQFYNFCEKVKNPLSCKKISEKIVQVEDPDGRLWNFIL